MFQEKSNRQLKRDHWLVVEPTHLKNMLVKMGSSSPNRDENKKSLKPPTSSFLGYHHLRKHPYVGSQVPEVPSFFPKEKTHIVAMDWAPGKSEHPQLQPNRLA